MLQRDRSAKAFDPSVGTTSTGVTHLEGRSFQRHLPQNPSVLSGPQVRSYDDPYNSSVPAQDQIEGSTNIE